MENKNLRITLNRVSKKYGSRVALKTATLSIGPGITGLLGPNGAGKTTLIGLISGMLAPSSGKISVLGTSPRNKRIKREIGLLPENINPPSVMKVGEFLDMIAGDRKTSLSDYLPLAGVETYSHKRISTLSKGMLQRVKFTAAIIGLPKVILLDEPFNGIDPVWRKKLTGFLREISSNRIILFSSHILEEVDVVCSEIIMIRAGFVIAHGPKEEIRKILTTLPYRVFIKTATPNIKKLASVLIEEELCTGVEIENDTTMVVKTYKIESLYSRIPKLAYNLQIPVTHLYPLSTETEDIFFALTGEGT